MMVALIGAAVGLTEWLRDLQEDLRRAQEAQTSSMPDYAFSAVVLTRLPMRRSRKSSGTSASAV